MGGVVVRWHDEFVAEPLVHAFGVIARDESFDEPAQVTLTPARAPHHPGVVAPTTQRELIRALQGGETVQGRAISAVASKGVAAAPPSCMTTRLANST